MRNAKRWILFLSLLGIGLSSCSSSFNPASIESNSFDTVNNKGAIGEFDLLTPFDGFVSDKVPTFTWEEAANAKTYTLEIASTETFRSDIDTELYYKKTNLSEPSFTMQSSLDYKNTTYYWRVTAINDANTKESKSTKSFYFAAPDLQEVKMDIGEADDWSVHQAGSHADVRIDNSDFFGTGEDSVAISFVEEDTNQGIVSSDGWLVLTKTVEIDTYGTDAVFFNFYYAGNDANVFLRLVDDTNEYWHTQIQVSNNARQSVIIKFDEFQLRYNDVDTNNETFDYYHIKYLELVFEKTFGDGVCLLSNIKAVRFADYSRYFISSLDFASFPETDWIYDNYRFSKQVSKTALTLGYSGSANEYNDAKINGFGLAKVTLNRYLTGGNAVSLKVRYSGYKGTNVLLRFYEQDKDRWFYRIPFSSLSTTGDTEFVIPFSAFAKSDINGDGVRQFYFILNVQFGVEGVYGDGSITFSDVNIVNLADAVDTSRRNVGADGIIDNFDSYSSTAEIYYKWKLSSTNKDEYISLNTAKKAGGASNLACAAMEYKSDMGPAVYTLPVNVEPSGANAISVWLKDASVKASSTSLAYLTEVRPTVAIVLNLKTGEEYRYTMDALPDSWNEYTIPFSSFEYQSGGGENTLAISPEGIGYVSIGMQYFYYTKEGKPFPAYISSNVVYVDNIVLTNASTLTVTPKERTIALDDSTSGLATVDRFDSYANDEAMLDFWFNSRVYDYSSLTLSDEVSTKGGTKSLKMGYRGNNAESVSYATMTKLSSDVKARGLRFDLKGDGVAKVYVNIYLSNGFQYRLTLTDVAASWNQYVIGFDNFVYVAGSSSTQKLVISNIGLAEKITFGVVNSSSTVLNSAVYLDNLAFDCSITSYATKEVTPL